ncbi:MAG TPA: hypothetical protein VM285_03995 [Polyangia bacterium]|nr:hypothetical protein [Polyangia bacterium]
MATRQSSNLVTGALALAVGLLLLGCSQDEGGGAVFEGQAALVTTTDYQSGAYSAIRLSDLATVNTIDIVHQDSVCRYDPITKFPYVVQRLGADAIAVVDTASDWQIVNEYSVGAGTNPQDIAVVAADRAYVSLFGESYLLVVHPTEGTVLGEIDLSAYADADGLPEASGLVHIGGSVYATVLRLEGFLPVNQSYLVEIDAATGAIVGDHPLAKTPSGRLRYNQVLERIVLVESGSFSEATDGGIELFDPATGQLTGLIVTEEQLGGDIVDAALASASVGFAIVGTESDAVGHTRVVMFDPAAGEVTKVIEDAEAWNHMYLELTPDHSQLWLAERRPSDPGVRIFDTATGDEITAEPLSTGLPPFSICFVEYE